MSNLNLSSKDHPEGFWWRILNDDARRGPYPAFVRRRFMRTLAYEERVFYLPDEGILFYIFCQGAGAGGPEGRGLFESFYIKPRNTLPDLKRRQPPPNTYYLDRVVFNQRAGAFRQTQVSPACSALWDELSIAREWESEIIHPYDGTYVERRHIATAQLESLKGLCEKRELIFGEALEPRVSV